MRKLFLSMVVLCLAATLAAAQTQSAASVCEIHVNKVKPGMTSQYRRRHRQLLGRQLRARMEGLRRARQVPGRRLH
jgi:hypothetical protein